jgi:hypothetical protein
MAENHTTSEPIDVRVIARALAAPFSETELKFKPQAVKGNRALALAYVDVRAIMDRLDHVVGFENWQDDYQLLPDNSVLCRLRLRIGNKWVTKMDVGGPSEQPDGGDRQKAAVSDALKRAAVKFGIGRYLYRLPQQWADYDPAKRQFTSPPRLPDWATAPKPAKAASPIVAEKKPGLPANGKELHRRLRDADNDLASKGLCPIGALLSHVTQAGLKAGFGADLNEWAGPAIELAIAETRAFKSRLHFVPEAKSVA